MKEGTWAYHSGENAGGSHSGDGAADDEGDGAGGSAADGRADLEEGDGAEEDGLDAVEGVQLAEPELEGAGGEQVRAAVPTNVRHRVKVVGDLRDGRGDDETVLFSPFLSQSLSQPIGPPLLGGEGGQNLPGRPGTC